MKLSVTIDQEQFDFIEEGIKETRFANQSHAVNMALKKLREESEKKNHSR